MKHFSIKCFVSEIKIPHVLNGPSCIVLYIECYCWFKHKIHAYTKFWNWRISKNLQLCRNKVYTKL